MPDTHDSNHTTPKQDRDFEMEDLVGTRASRAVHLAMFQAGYDTRNQADMRQFSEDLRSMRTGNLLHTAHSKRFGAGVWTAAFMLLAFAISGIFSLVAALPIWEWVHGSGGGRH
jgi:hypothetical protein